MAQGPTSDSTPALDAPARNGSSAGAPSRPWAQSLVKSGVHVAATVPISIGGMYLVSWFVGLGARWAAAGVLTMKTNMALSLVLSGVALVLLDPRRTTPRRRAAAVFVAVAVLLVGALTLYEHIFRIDLGIDQLLATEPFGAAATASPNRMGPPGSASLVLLALGLLAVALRRRVAAYFAVATAIVVLVPAIGYLFGIVPFYGKASTGIAWLTLVCLMSLGVGLVLVETRDGPLGLLWRDNPGGKLLRQLLPAAVFGPLVVQLLMRVGAHYGLYGHETGVGILLISLILVISGLLWRSALHLDIEASRARQAEERAVSVARLPDENPDPVLRLSRDFEVAYANAAACSALATLGVAVGTRAPRTVVEIAERAVSEGKRVQGEVAAGDRFYSMSIVAAGDDVNVYAHDITQRRRAERELDAERMRWRGVVEGIADEVWVCDATGRMTLINLPETTAMGLPEFENKTVHEVLEELDMFYPDGRPRPPEEAPLLRSLRSGEVVRGEELMRHRKSGKSRHRQFSCAPMRDATGAVTGSVAIIRDITAYKGIEQELRDANRAKDDFLGMLSHELRNPLAPIRNSLYILDHAEPTGQVARRAKEVANRQLTHLTRLVDDLLDVTRIVRGKVELRRTDLDITELTRRIAEDHRSLMSERGLQFGIETPNAAVWVNGDETRLAQVIGNLLQNAAKFTPEGGRITVSVTDLTDTVEVRVRDTGAGVDPELLAEIFNPFVQAKQSLARTQGGLGLGLSLAKAFVEMHGGTVMVESAGRDRGAVFTVKLPVVPAASVSADAPARLDSRPTNHLRVLVVEDNKDAAESLADLVRVLGHDVEVAFDGESAVRLVNAHHFDIVLCDIGLPGMSGYQVAEALRRDERFDSVQLVAVSGYALPEDRQRALDAGFAEHIAKPADPANVLRVLRGGKHSRPV